MKVRWKWRTDVVRRALFALFAALGAALGAARRARRARASNDVASARDGVLSGSPHRRTEWFASVRASVEAIAAKVLARAARGATPNAGAGASASRDASERRREEEKPLSPKSGHSPRGARTSEEIARAKEAAKERKRRAREEQEEVARREEAERAEIARLVELERKKREAARAAAEETFLAKRAREDEAARIAAAREAALEVEEKRKRDAEAEHDERENVKSKPEDAPNTVAVKDSSKNVPVLPVTRKPAPVATPRSGFTLRSIPPPRAAPAIPAPSPATATAPLVAPPLPAGPPPAYAKLGTLNMARTVDSDPPLPPMSPLVSPTGTPRTSFSRWNSLSSDNSSENGNQTSTCSPRSVVAPSSRPVVPPGFEHMPLSPKFNNARQSRSSFNDEVDADSEWAAVDSTIALFLESTASETRPLQSRVSSEFGGIFRPNLSMKTSTEPLPPLPPTPHPEMLSGLLTATMDD